MRSMLNQIGLEWSMKFQYPWDYRKSNNEDNKQIAVIGAGIVGLAPIITVIGHQVQF